jgi:hypothetical protein
LKTVDVLVLMVAADAPDLSCEEQQQIIDWALCISR